MLKTVLFAINQEKILDEQLFPTKTHCRFTQYMASKPDKFDIKFWIAVDLESKYILNAIPYLGKDETRPATQRLSESVVIKLVEPYLGKGRNVTTDNFFTSIYLATQPQKKKTSLVGTPNKIQKEVPPLVKTLHQSRYSSKTNLQNSVVDAVDQFAESVQVV